MNIDYTKSDEHRREISENEEVALKFLEQKDYRYNFCYLDDKYKNDKIFLLKAIEKNKFILLLTNIFNEKELKLLFEKYFEDINIQDENKDTALILASEKGYTEIVKLLLQYPNIDINIQNEDKITALILASDQEHVEVLQLLLQKENIDLNIRDRYNCIALISTFITENRAIKKLLKDYNKIHN